MKNEKYAKQDKVYVVAPHEPNTAQSGDVMSPAYRTCQQCDASNGESCKTSHLWHVQADLEGNISQFSRESEVLRRRVEAAEAATAAAEAKCDEAQQGLKRETDKFEAKLLPLEKVVISESW